VVQRLQLIGFGLGLGLGLLELGLWLADYSVLTPYRLDPQLGHVGQPGAEGWWRGENTVYLRLNSQGWRDVERSVEKPAGTIRLALLGDSFAAGFDVPLAATVGAVLERELNGCWGGDGRRVEVLNFAVVAYGTAQELLLLRGQVGAYQPDLVLLGFFSGNDVRDNYRPLSRGKLKPFFTWQDGEPAVDNSFRELPEYRLRASPPGQAFYWLEDRSRLVQLLHQSVRTASLRWLTDRPPAAERPAGRSVGLVEQVLLPPASQPWQQAWEVTERLLLLVQAEASKLGAGFALAVFPLPQQVDPDPAWRARYQRALGLDSLLYPEQRLTEFGRQHGLEVIPLAVGLRTWAERQQVNLHGHPPHLGSGHWNEQGHLAAGRLLAERFCRLRPDQLSAGPGGLAPAVGNLTANSLVS
jgi:hypothetical protein